MVGSLTRPARRGPPPRVWCAQSLEAPLLPAPLALAPLLALTAAAVAPPAPPPPHLWGVGEQLEGATVEESVQHAEFQRATLRLADGSALQVELLPAARVSGPACAHHGYALAPRWELRGEAVEVEDQPPPVLALCARLAARGPPPVALDLAPPPPGTLSAHAAADPPPAQTVGPPPPRGGAPAWLFAGAAGAALGLALGGRRLLAGAAWPPALALLLGVLLSALVPGGLLVGPDGGATPLAQAATGAAGGRLYGPAWAALSHALTGGDPRLVFPLNKGIAALFPAIFTLALGGLLPGLRSSARAWAGAAAALSPALLRVSGTEIPHITLLCVEGLALGALGAALRQGTPAAPAAALALAGGCLAGLAPALRPEALPFVAVPFGAVLLADRRRRPLLAGAALVAAALAAPRLAALYGDGPASGAAAPAALLRALVPARPLFALDAPLRGPLVALGALAACRLSAPGPRLAALALALSLGPTLHKGWPLADLWRLQLPSLAPALALAAAGAAALPRWVPALDALARRGAPLGLGARGSLGLALLVISGLIGIPGAIGPWAPRADWAALSAAAEGLPPGSTLLIAGDTPHAAEQATALLAIAAAAHPGAPPEAPALRVAAVEGVVADPAAAADPPLFAYEGLRCAVGYPAFPQGVSEVNPCATMRSRCGVEVVWERSAPPVGDLDLDWPTAPVPLRLLRLRGCRPGVGWVSAGP